MLWIRYSGLEAGGHFGDVAITEFSGISNDLRLDRTDRIGRDGQAVGKDYLTKRVWSLTLTTLEDDENGAVALAQKWEQAVLDPSVMQSLSMAYLEYSRDQQTWYRVYGRPSDYAGPDLGQYSRHGAGQIDLQFEQLDPLHYLTSESSTRVNVVAGMLGSGVRAPVRAPVRTTLSNFEPRAGVVVNSGDRPAVVRVRFQGPCANPRVWAEGFEAGYTGRLAHDQSVTLDGRAMTAILRGGGRSPRHVAGAVTRKTRLSKLTVPPGTSNLWFEADDPTGTSYVEVFWRDAFTSMQ